MHRPNGRERKTDLSADSAVRVDPGRRRPDRYTHPTSQAAQTISVDLHIGVLPVSMKGLIKVSACPITFRAWMPKRSMSHTVSRRDARIIRWFDKICWSLVPTCSMPIAVQFIPIACRQRTCRFTN